MRYAIDEGTTRQGGGTTAVVGARFVCIYRGSNSVCELGGAGT